MVLRILEWAIVIRAFLSWFPHSPKNPIIKIVYDVTEPILRPFRAIRFGNSAMMVDFSPIFALITLMILRSVILPPIFAALATVF